LRRFSDTLPGVVEGTREDLNAKVLDPLHGLLTNADGTISRLREEIVEKIVAEATRTLAQGTEALAAAQRAMSGAETVVTEGGPKAVAVLANLEATTSGLDARLDTLEKRLDAVLARADGLLAEGRPEVAELLQSLRRASWEVEMLARKVRSNPALVLFGDDEEDQGATPYDLSGLRRTGRAKPYSQRDEGAAGD
jgi:ABC-type transporter Mla subunit MlaD